MSTAPNAGSPDTGAGAPDLPEAAVHRLSGGAWSSGLSVADFASCLDMGMEPLGYVQGYAVMQWSWYMSTGGFAGGFGGGFGGPALGTGAGQGRGQYVEQWQCPHGFVSAEHRTYGVNYELTWLERSWSTGWGLAVGRMVEEAASLGATGVVGVFDDMRPLVGAPWSSARAARRSRFRAPRLPPRHSRPTCPASGSRNWSKRGSPRSRSRPP